MRRKEKQKKEGKNQYVSVDTFFATTIVPETNFCLCLALTQKMKNLPAVSVVTRQPILYAANFWTASYTILSSWIVKSMAEYPLNLSASSIVAASLTVEVKSRRIIIRVVIVPVVLLAIVDNGDNDDDDTAAAAAFTKWRRAAGVEEADAATSSRENIISGSGLEAGLIVNKWKDFVFTLLTTLLLFV